MSEPIKSGDQCIVTAGLGREKSPNIGVRVTVGLFQGEHSRYGRVFTCTGEGLRQLHPGGSGYITTGWADIPAAWLRKAIDPMLDNKANAQGRATA